MGFFNFFNRIPSFGNFSFFKPFVPAKKVSTFLPFTFAAALPFVPLPVFGSSIFNFSSTPTWGDTFTKTSNNKKSGSVSTSYVGSSSTTLSGKDCTKYDGLIKKYALKYGVEPNFVKAVMKKESTFNPKAGSGAGAKGLMQLMPATAASLGVKNVYDPEQNIEAGVRMLRDLGKKYKGDKKMILAAYNWGSGNLAKYGFGNRPAETRNYVTKVLQYYNDYNRCA